MPRPPDAHTLCVVADTHFDLIVLGAGPGGYVAAIRASQLGLKVAVVEEKYWGGVCLNVGCIPSKALLRNAELAHTVLRDGKTFGISGDVSFDFGAAFDRSRKVSDGIVKGVHFLMKKNKITEINGYGTFVDAKTVEVDGTRYTFDNCIIATGSVVKTLPGIELSENVVSYEEQILSRDLPDSVVVVGAGAIGMEFAYIMNAYGVDVTIVEYMDRVGRFRRENRPHEPLSQFTLSDIERHRDVFQPLERAVHAALEAGIPLQAIVDHVKLVQTSRSIIQGIERKFEDNDDGQG